MEKTTKYIMYNRQVCMRCESEMFLFNHVMKTFFKHEVQQVSANCVALY